MKKTQFEKRLLLLFVCTVLIAAMALLAVGCGDSTGNGDVEAPESGAFEDGSTLGEGSTQFTFTVVGLDGEEKSFEIHTDKTTVGAALLEVGMIAGEEGQYGLYVKTVNGETLNYDTDGKYWAFYVNGAYAASGVDTTEIKADDTYTFRAE